MKMTVWDTCSFIILFYKWPMHWRARGRVQWKGKPLQKMWLNFGILPTIGWKTHGINPNFYSAFYLIKEHLKHVMHHKDMSLYELDMFRFQALWKEGRQKIWSMLLINVKEYLFHLQCFSDSIKSKNGRNKATLL